MRASMTTFRIKEYGVKGAGSYVSDHAVVLSVRAGVGAVNADRVSQRRIG